MIIWWYPLEEGVHHALGYICIYISDVHNINLMIGYWWFIGKLWGLGNPSNIESKNSLQQQAGLDPGPCLQIHFRRQQKKAWRQFCAGRLLSDYTPNPINLMFQHMGILDWSPSRFTKRRYICKNGQSWHQLPVKISLLRFWKIYKYDVYYICLYCFIAPRYGPRGTPLLRVCLDPGRSNAKNLRWKT